MRKLVLSFFGAGYVPKAPGTAGSAATLGVYLAMSAALDEPWLAVACGVAALAASALTVGLGNRVVEETGESDPQFVVTDEAAGMLLAVLWMPGYPVWFVAAAGFGWFRLLDIVKPLGIKRLERLGGGWGILADDLAAGAVANLLVRLGAVLWGFALVR